MNVHDATTWLEQLAATQIPRERISHATRMSTGEKVYDYEEQPAAKWVVEVESALQTIFPAGHPLAARCAATMARANGNPHYLSDESTVDAMRAIVTTARDLLKSGRIHGLVEGIRAETVDDLLSQASALVAGGYLAAATVITGGALETHLRTLCVARLGWTKDSGTLSDYNAALSQARNAGNEIVTSTDSKLITGWSGRRNDAAHKPAEFSATAAEVENMIDGVRQLLARTR